MLSNRYKDIYSSVVDKVFFFYKIYLYLQKFKKAGAFFEK